MEVRHDDLERLARVFLVHPDRDAAAVVLDGDRVVGVDRDRDLVAVTDLRFVDRVVDELEDHVVEAGEIIGVAEVHARPLANGLEALQELDRIGGVGRAHRTPTARKIPRADAAPPRTSSTAQARPAQRAAGDVVVRTTAASSGSASKNSSAQASERPASKSSAPKRGASPVAVATALHSASFASATVRAA